jgi:hypothetical protein
MNRNDPSEGAKGVCLDRAVMVIDEMAMLAGIWAAIGATAASALQCAQSAKGPRQATTPPGKRRASLQRKKSTDLQTHEHKDVAGATKPGSFFRLTDGAVF